MNAETGPSTADIETGIRAELATIRKWWPHTFDPPKSTGAGARDTPASRFPGNDTAISLRAEVTHDLAFWVHAVIEDSDLMPTRPRAVPVPTLTVTTTWIYVDEPATLNLDDVPAVCVVLEGQAKWISGWEHGNRMWDEMTTLAREVRNLAAPPVRDTMPIGECPECSTVVRAKAHDPGNIKCKGCGTTDTIDGWIIRVVGNEPLVTAEQLVPILHKRMGLVASRARIRAWKARGVIHSSGEDEAGRTLYDRKAVFAALAKWEATRDGEHSA